MEKPVTKAELKVGELIMPDREAFEQMAKQVNDIHAVLFGVEGQGGVQRRVAALEEDSKAVHNTLGKLAGLGIAASAIFGAVGAKIISLFGNGGK